MHYFLLWKYPVSLHSLIAECDGSGEPNIEPQVRNTYAF